eukprot:TRINITY_DN3537_c0_g1_i3.p1 TRINITY_DN3537_c0_g1~~TRINITY_DN3537_c0_g1_i3.p1  ORF type:complete len:356 (-),score=78.96 TRINITY_DN3537_c0_g1_i3:479-1546(-)
MNTVEEMEAKERENCSEISSSRDHLIITVNGIGGSATDWKFAAEQFMKTFPDKVIVHCSSCNQLKETYDGIDVMGERLADEVLNVVQCYTGVKKISFIALSLGALVTRYAIGKLYEPPDGTGSAKQDIAVNNQNNKTITKQSRGTIAGLEPANFITVATPHLGCKGKKQVPILCGLPILEKIASLYVHLVIGRTGSHLFLTDVDDGKPPLLLRMVKDYEGLYFMSGLQAFEYRIAYANVAYDYIVGWRTSSIRRENELPKMLSSVDKRYPHIVYIQNANDDLEPTQMDSNACHATDQEEEEMIGGLAQVPWQRIDVRFKSAKHKCFAHSAIQVKFNWLNPDAADVVFHMIENFHL